MKTKRCSVEALQGWAGGRAKAAVAAGALLLAAAATARAQTPDPRWQAWLGCWTPQGAAAPAVGAKVPLVCVMPLANAAGIEVVSLVDTQVVSRDTVLATGERRAISRDGCEGWESGEWSSQGQRVYLHSEYTCPGGLKRTSSGLMAMTADGAWLDVQGVVLRGRTAVRVARYEDAGLPVTLPDEIWEFLLRRAWPVDRSRLAAMAELTPADVVEASRSLDPALVEAWLAENGQGFDLDAKQLAALSDAGVADRVMDVLVALSYPGRFAVNRASSRRDSAPVAETPIAPDFAYPNVGYGYGCLQPLGYYSPWGWDGYDPCYSPFGYSPYGYNPRYGYGPNYGGGPVVIVVGTGQAQPHGRVQKGVGYTQNGQPSGGGTQAHPRDENSSADRREAPAGSSASSGGWSSGRSASPSPPPSSSPSPSPSSSSGEGRTAKPRP